MTAPSDKLTPPKRKCEGWLNVFPGGMLYGPRKLFGSKAEADEALGFAQRQHRIDCVRVEYPEPA